MNQTPRRTLADYAQIPLAIGSFVFFKITRLVMRGFVALVSRPKRGKAASWRVVSAELIRKPLALPIFMTKAPRWNPHAIIATAGPLIVDASITIDITVANESAQSWGLSIQPLGRGREARISSGAEAAASAKTLPLPAGTYQLVMRYYGPHRSASLPAIHVDDHEQVPAQTLDPDTNSFYTSLSQRSSWLYAWLGFHVYTMLRFADWLPKSFVTRQYLPAGDPDMRYEFGAVSRGDALRITVPRELLSNYTIYFTRYNRASFPVMSQEIEVTESTISGITEDGYYLIRMLLRDGCVDAGDAQALTVMNLAAQ